MGSKTVTTYFCDICKADCTSFREGNYGLPTVFYEAQGKAPDKNTHSFQMCRDCNEKLSSFIYSAERSAQKGAEE